MNHSSFVCVFSVATSINEAQGIGEEETRKMKKARMGADDRVPPPVPSFLRPQEEAGGSKSGGSAWRPAWGLRAKDSVVGNTRHAKDWSRFGVPPCDYRDIVTATGMEAAEYMCAQGIATVLIILFFYFSTWFISRFCSLYFFIFVSQTNTYFQAMVHDAKAWKTSSERFEKDLGKEKMKVDSLTEQLEAKDKELADAFARVVHLEESKETAIDEYLDSAEYREILLAHDDSVYPVSYSHGWEGALKAVDSRYPNMFSFSDFPCPENPQIPSHLVEHSIPTGEQTPDPDSAPMETHDGVEEENGGSGCQGG